MTSAGIWLRDERRLVVVVIGPDGTRRPPLRVARTDAARAGLVCYLMALGPDVRVALAESLAAREPLVERLRKVLETWLVPDPLLDALAAAAGLGHAAERQRAALLARLPSVGAFRPMLRRLVPADPRQLDLVP